MSGRLFTVGDIHGCAAELEALLRGLPVEAGDTIAFVGDYVDRGPNSKEVVDQLIALRQRADIKTVFLKGNHEDMCLSYLGRAGLIQKVRDGTMDPYTAALTILDDATAVDRLTRR